MNVIILMGAPGSGKGTTAEKIRDKAGYKHVSTGDMLREAVAGDTELGREADGYMKSGALVPDELIVKMIEELFNSGPADASYMLDGFPRTVPQAELLDKALEGHGTSVKKVFFLDVPEEVLIQRLTGRRVCRACGASFHVINIPPKQEGVCDACGGELYQRADDCKETIVNRLDVYNKQTESLISRYEEQGVLAKLDGDQGADNLAAEVLELLK